MVIQIILSIKNDYFTFESTKFPFQSFSIKGDLSNLWWKYLPGKQKIKIILLLNGRLQWNWKPQPDINTTNISIQFTTIITRLFWGELFFLYNILLRFKGLLKIDIFFVIIKPSTFGRRFFCYAYNCKIIVSARF